MSQRIIFAGTPEFAAEQLQALLDAGIKPIAVYSQPDRPKGRGKKLQPTPVKAIAQEHDIDVYQPLNFKEEGALETLEALKPDLMIVVAYGLLLPEAVLNIPTLGCINIHASLLPRWRGAAPIERAIEHGDSTTGITIMQMDKGLDTGDMLAISECAINSQTTGDSLRTELSSLGATTLIKVLPDILAQKIQGEKQDDSLANYAHKLSKAEAELDWQQSATALQQKIQAFDSSNICYSSYQGERIKIAAATAITSSTNNTQAGQILAVEKVGIKVATGDGELLLTELQLPNAKRLPVQAILNGRQNYFIVGQCFGQ